ncbi:MAG TPA: hypothetical protein DIT07_14925, partial [Sphingobacteriaceae bacterium]|nr:hypothetical protein [Sphingobacteriaceae bacterium]
YSDHLKTARYDVMLGMQKDLSQITERAIESEALRISEEEYIVLTGKKFDGTDDTRLPYEYFGYSNATELERMAGTGVTDGIHEFLRRSGMTYTELVELIKTKFINPHQNILDYLEQLFVNSGMNASVIYNKLQQIKSGILIPSSDTDVMAALISANISSGDFVTWVQSHFDDFDSVITLFQSNSMCDLDTTCLRTIKNVYSGITASGITDDTNAMWLKIHRFIRLWRKLGWKINEVDLMLTALSEDDITQDTISKLSQTVLLNKELKLPLNRLATLWGSIDTYGEKSLFKILFLNKAVQKIDTAFEADKFGKYLSDETKKLQDHVPAILAAFRMSEEDLQAILSIATVIDQGNPRPFNIASDILNITNLSTIYRYTVLSKALKLKVPDCCLLISLFNATPFSSFDIQQDKFVNITPADTFDFYKLAGSVKKAGFKPVTLQYIFKGTLPAESKLGLDTDKVKQTARTIREAFASIEQDHPEIPAAPFTSEILKSKLLLTFQPETVNLLMAIVDGTASFTSLSQKNLRITIPEDLSLKYSYINGSGRIICKGIMSEDEKAALLAINANDAFRTGVESIYSAPEIFIADNFCNTIDGAECVFKEKELAFANLLNHPVQTPEKAPDEKLYFIYSNYLPLLKQKLHKDAIIQNIASLIGVSEVATAVLLQDELHSLIDSIALQGFSADYFSDTNWTTPELKRTDREIDFAWSQESPDPSLPADNFSVRWQSFISPPSGGEYTLIVDVREADEAFNLYLDEALILQKAAADVRTSLEVVSLLNASQMYKVVIEYSERIGNAGIALSWKTATTAKETIPPASSFPADVIDNFIKTVKTFHQSAKFIAGFKLTDKEVNHFANYRTDFDNFDFKTITPTHWKQINNYVRLRNAVPQSQSLLTDVFVYANIIDPVPTIDSLTKKLSLSTGWDTTTVSYLINDYFGLTVDKFKNEVDISRIYAAVSFVLKTGLSAQTMAELAAPETDFDKLNTTADLVKRAVKAKYEDEDWLKIAGNLSDTTRENQKQALISYLLTKQELIDWGAVDADGLFEYFLIDVQMGPCMDTSRIVQATAAVQQFVSRCLLNLESDIQGGLEKGVSPAAIDTDRWEWMKNYRVSEANRKVFLYPENWLEPEWRDDRSPFFKELESELIQNDITTRSVETAFRNYLTKLNTVANLEILGTYQENDVEGNFSMLHVVGTTNNPPYQYFYRTWNAFMKWSAWEKVQVDIRSVDEGENSGVHLMPLVWKGRRFILFTEFIQKVQKNSDNDNKTADALSKQPMSQLNPTKYWEIRLAWTEYIDGKWSPKQLTKEFIRGNGGEPCNYTYHTYINPTTNGLTVSLTYQGTSLLGGFMLADIQSKVFAYDFSGPRSFEFQFSPSLVVNTTLTARIFDSSVEQGFQDAVFYNPPDENYRNFFMKHKKNGHFLFNSDVYLDKIIDHKILYSSQVLDFETTINYPFFYTDDKRTYFVRPIDVKILDQVKQPDLYFPPAIQFIDSSRKGSPLPVAIDSKIKTDAPTPGYKTPKLTDLSVIGKAFGFGKPLSDTGKHPNWHTGKGMEFHTFYHPFSSQYVTNLNQEGIKGLMDSDTKLNEENQLLYNDSGDGFINNYNPNFQQRFVRKAPESNDYKAGEAYTFYKENICFDVYGANSIYNWELFFQAPLYIATRLSKDGKFEEAMKWFHYIFDPTTDELPIAGQSETSRYWKTLPFKTTPSENLEQMFSALTLNDNPLAENPAIAEWRKNPFKPFKVAENRPIAFKKNVVMKYVENLIAWGDSLFRMFTRESVNEALQIYVIANHILGPRPQLVPKRGKIKAETYDSLKDKWDDFGNALVELENVFPYSGEIPVSSSNTGPGLLGIGSALYFCIPGNEKLMEYWDTAADRLYKIRHCMDIDGVERQLALFSPVIDPAMLINATAQGLSLGSILADLSSPPPIYRFNYLIQRANDFCLEVKSLGSTLLSVLEKKDGEELGRLRASHETIILELMTAIKERQVLDAKVTGEGLQKARETAELRLHYYNSLLNPEDITVPDAPTTDANLTIDSQLPVDTSLAEIQTDVDVSLIESNERGVKLIGKEKQDIDLGNSSANNQITAMGAEIIAGFLGLIPQFNEIGTPLGVGASTGFGGRELGWFASTIAKTHSTQASIDSINSGQSAKMAGYIRREQEWTLQANLAIREIIQLDKQITSADIRVQISEKELENHKAQIENSKQVELFLKDKFTNQELYQWMKEQFFTVYKQSFNMAYDMAKKVEKCYQYETGNESTNFIQYGYWDNSQQGLCAGEKLHLSLRQMEKSYLEENKREFELTKSISISIINPVALQELKATGKCFVSVPEELFDLDYQGHYFRRIKSVSLSIPCIAGPYISANCTLRLLKNIVRLKTTMNDDGLYEHNNDEGIWIDDDRFRESNVPVKSIATSTGQRDSGMFE